MTELPQAASRRELREREQAARAAAELLRPPALPSSLPAPRLIATATRVAPSSVPAEPPLHSAHSASAGQSCTRGVRDMPGPLVSDRAVRSISRPTGRSATRRRGVASRLLSLGALVFAAALAVGMSVPADALSAAAGTATTGSRAAETVGDDASDSASGIAVLAQSAGAQSATVATDQTVAAGSRDDYGVLSYAQVLAQSYATITDYKYAGGKGAIRWPFVGHAAISSPFGPRAPLCATCTSTFHSGTDFLPGVGAPIFAIANGVVIDHTENVTDLGNNVTIRHKIGKDTVTSTYGHMQAGSSPLVVGQVIHVGDFVGLVGSTGESTGPHLHLGITVNGVQVDPVPWMTAHVK